MATKKYTSTRARSLKIGVSEEMALGIVIPYVSITAYTLSILTKPSMPVVTSFTNSVLSAKHKLATLIANKIGEPVNPKHMHGVTVEAVAVGGYFKVRVTETNHKTRVIKTYNVTLQCETGLPLIEKFRQTQNLTDATDTINAFNKMGL